MSLGISESTVNWHISNAFERLGASSRAEAVALAIRSNGVDRVPEAVTRVPPVPAPTRPDWRRLVAIAIAIAIFGALLGGATVATLLLGPAGPLQNPTASPLNGSDRAPTATPARGAHEGVVELRGVPIDGAVDVGTTPAGSPLPDAPASLVPTISAPPLPSITVPLPTPPLPNLPVTVTPLPLPSLPLPTPIPTPRLPLP